MPRADNVLIALRPRFDVVSPHTRKCLNCRKGVDQTSAVFCQCRCCSYCSNECRRNDRDNHALRCRNILGLASDLDVMVNIFDLPRNIRANEGVREYFAKRERLIEELLIEGRRANDDNIGGVRRNELAFDIAIRQCYDIFFLHLPSHADQALYNIQNICLMAGRFSDLYNISLYVARKGLRHPGLHQDLDCMQNQVSHQNVAGPSFNRFDVNSFEPNSMCHLFIIKCWLHFNVTNLNAINEDYLNNKDCMNLIGKFLGLQEEWIVSDKNLYRDQAYEIARHFYCELTYFDINHPALHYFGAIKEFGNKHFSAETKHFIDVTIETASKWVNEMENQKKQAPIMSDSRWTRVLESYKADYDHVFNFCIQPVLPGAIEEINELAGYDAIGGTFNTSLTITQLITEGVNACRDRPYFQRSYFFQTLFDFMYGWEDLSNDLSTEDVGDVIGYPAVTLFHQAIAACVSIEQKLAQSHFHKNKGCPRIQELLYLLPGGHTKYCCNPTPVRPFVEEIYSQDKLEETVSSASTWLKDVTKIVDALVDEGLATDENLAMLFGRSGYVSYRIWELGQEKLEQNQPKIEPFCKRSKIWREGYIEYDSSSGLKIQYLKLQERREKYNELRKILPIGSLVQSMKPPIRLFVDQFGWEKLDMKCDTSLFECGCFGNMIGSGLSTNKKDVIRKHGLDKFQTAQDACRHYYDAITIEEAIWDFVGVPRLVVVNANNSETMHKSGWTCWGVKHKLGDKSVQLGSRCAHVYFDGHCTVWKEKQEDDGSSVDNMDLD